MAEKIRVRFIFEILGRPPEHVIISLEEFIKKFGEIKGVEIISKKIHEPKEVEDESAKGLFATFAEVEAFVSDLNILFGIIFHMLPSNIEVIRPTEISIDNVDLSMLLSELAIKMHKYDEAAKTLVLENKNLLNKIRELQENQNPVVISSNVFKEQKEDIKTKKQKRNKSDSV